MLVKGAPGQYRRDSYNVSSIDDISTMLCVEWREGWRVQVKYVGIFAFYSWSDVSKCTNIYV